MLSLRYAAPAADLRPFISTYYLFQADLADVVDTTRADLPQIRFMLDGQGYYTFGGGYSVACPPAMVTGPTTAATQFAARGPLLVFGAGIFPLGWNVLIGASATELTDGVEDAHAIFGPLASNLLETLRNSNSFEAMIAIADMTFRMLIQQPKDRPQEWFIRATNQWLMGETSPNLDDLIRETRLSARQIERLANRLYGAPPKLLARKYRSLRIASLLADQRGDWRDLIGEAFYDQSHFIREFKRFTGQTPRQFQLNPSPVTKLMSARRRLGNILPPIAVDT
jgi:AraC-like DNA-binding protein